MNMNSIRKIATIAAVAVALTAGTAFANSNSPTVEQQRHWRGHASTPTQHGVTIGVFNHGRGVGEKPSSPHWR